jgi:hypothetical protein
MFSSLVTDPFCAILPAEDINSSPVAPMITCNPNIDIYADVCHADPVTIRTGPVVPLSSSRWRRLLPMTRRRRHHPQYVSVVIAREGGITLIHHGDGRRRRGNGDSRCPLDRGLCRQHMRWWRGRSLPSPCPLWMTKGYIWKGRSMNKSPTTSSSAPTSFPSESTSSELNLCQPLGLYIAFIVISRIKYTPFTS